MPEIFVDTVDTFRRQRGTSLAEAAIVNVARERASGLVATIDTDLTAIEGVSVAPR